MGFTLRFPKFLTKNVKDGESTPPESSEPSPCNSRPTSRTPSIRDGASTPVTPEQKYLYDPMRHNKRADYIGSFVDPMATGGHSQGIDVTNTGA
ncbi:hypothetical protein K492DRAFT_174993 [Lichtheimia hyalospora FSU 10163]|nr:hypothetical protein K492DRAFT_174993 [Lichtheimia hyalospora FSU 10163]